MGLGPGHADLLSPQALKAIENARAIVGYRPYVDMIPENLKAGKTVITTGMKGELTRVRRALEQAVSGISTVVVSSGDPGVYGMAGLVLEVVEKKGLWDQVDIEILPGIPALTAAAALLGAPLVHDFAVVSLSDLLTPWELIETRLKHAAKADFVIVLYNPRSKKRHWQLGRALEIVSKHRGPETPVGLVYQAFRPGQKISVFALGGFDPKDADMLSIVFIGNSQTCMAKGGMLTPRGYMEKYE
ncbi:MAG: precorrin-3B C(17)-methyltransferase [Thermodesulfobacteriota bacterium]|nr:precorrin-3B C(17)-methyltransferase [Thermodesulfobacteriota bacterium]